MLTTPAVNTDLKDSLRLIDLAESNPEKALEAILILVASVSGRKDMEFSYKLFKDLIK